METLETTQDFIDKYVKLLHRAEENYQLTGEPRYLNSAWKYEHIVDAFQAKAELENEVDTRRKKRMTNCEHAIDQLEFRKNDTFTYEEVVNLLRDAVDW